MIRNIKYSPKFTRNFKKLSYPLRVQAVMQIKILTENIFDPRLRTHKLSGNLRSYFSFSVTYSNRIVFSLEKDGSVTFLDIGDHSIYR